MQAVPDSQRMASEARDMVFTGSEGLTCHQFILGIRERALEAGNQGNDQWMANQASVLFRGNAQLWFESLDEETQNSWKLLRRSLLARYAQPAPEEPGTLSSVKDERSAFVFTGKNKEECRAFIREIRLRAYEEGKDNDSSWMLRLAFPCFAGNALEWHASLPDDIRTSWHRLEKAVLIDYPLAPPQVTSPARVFVERWSIEAPSSASLQHLNSREDWLCQAEERRRLYQEVKYNSTPCWLLVETEKDIPEAALITGFERTGEPLYSARAWMEGQGLIVGKCGRHIPGACLPIRLIEVQGVRPFEVLVGDSSYFRWVAVPYQVGKPNPITHQPFVGVEAGVELAIRHRATFICQFKHEGSLSPGKVHSTHTVGNIGWGGKEHKQETHYVRLLAWAK